MTPSLPPEGDLRTHPMKTTSSATLAIIFACMSMVSFFVCCPFVFPIGFAVPAWILARNDLKQIDQGRLVPNDRGTLRAASIIALISLWFNLILLVGIILALIFVTIPEGSIVWEPQDPDSLSVEETRFNQDHGMVLYLYAPEGVAEVWLDDSLAESDEEKVRQVGYWICPGDYKDQVKLLVKWHDEEYFYSVEGILGVRSTNGYWATTEYNAFHDEIPNEEWDELMENAKFIAPKEDAIHPPTRKENKKLWEVLAEID